MADGIEGRLPEFDQWLLNPETRQLARDGRAVPLSERAFDLLVVLASSSGHLVPTDTLLAQVWPGRVVEGNNLHVHMSALRKLLGEDAIRTVRGRGYQLTRALRTRQSSEDSPAPSRVARAVRAAGAGNVPRHPSPLIGRREELATLRSLLGQHRAVTITGPAGVGKTRLAQAAALEVRWLDRWQVELAGVAEGAPVAARVARAMGLTLPGLQAADDELADVLRDRAVLLVLDNCEHRAREVGQLVDTLIGATTGVRVLATSQALLEHRDEQRFRLEPLALPPLDASRAQAAATGAVALFCERLAAHNGDFSLDTIDAQRLADVVAICRKLDGLPLALELAAARVPLLGLTGLRERLGQQLQLLGGVSSEAPARQRTLQAALACSHAMLGDEERVAFRRLGAFGGSFSLELAQQVLSAGIPVDEWRTLDLLHRLLDKSLLVSTPAAAAAPESAQPRLRLLESTRAFAQERLQASGEWPATTERLRRALVRLFDRGEGPRHYGDEQQSLPRCAAELDNLRSALDALAERSESADEHIELAGASAWIWSRLGLRAEGQWRCHQALQRVSAATPARLEARLQLAWVSLVHRCGADGDIAAATRAVLLYQSLDDRLGRFRALQLLAATLAFCGHEADTLATLEELADSFDPGWGAMHWAGYTTTMAVALAQIGHDDEAMALVAQGQRHLEQLDDPEARAGGWCALARGYSALASDFESAFDVGQRALAAARELRHGGRLGLVLGDLADTLVELGRVDEALVLMTEAVSLRALDGTLGRLLDQLAHLACARGRFVAAAMALGRADVHHAVRGGRRERYLARPHRQAVAAVDAALPPRERQQARARGAAMGDREVAVFSLAG